MHLIIGAKPFVIHTFGFDTLEGVDLTRVTAIRFAINPDGPDYDGTLWLDDLRVGGMALPAPEMTGVPDWLVVTGAAPFTIPLHDRRTYVGKMNPVVKLEARSDNPALLPDPILIHQGDDRWGELRISPVPGATGEASIQIAILDDDWIGCARSISLPE